MINPSPMPADMPADPFGPMTPEVDRALDDLARENRLARVRRAERARGQRPMGLPRRLPCVNPRCRCTG